MSQMLKDLGLRLKSDRKTQVVAALVCVAGLFLLFSDNTQRRGRPPKKDQQTTAGAGDHDERWTDLVARFDGQLKSQAQTLSSLQADQAAQMKKMEEFENTTAEIFQKILERISSIEQAPAGQNAVAGPKDVPDISGPEIVAADPEELTSFASDSVPVQPPPAPAKPKLAAIMPGDSVRVKLLAGVNAPTDGTPYPVVLKLLGNVMGPDGNTIPLGEARLIAAAQGSLTDSRVLFRLTRLSIRLSTGRRKEFAVDGWIVGEDGIRGMSGVLIDPIGKAIGGAAMAGGLAGLGQAVAAANQQNYIYGNGTSSISVDDASKYAGGVALSSAAEQWQLLIRDRVSQLVPVVQVLSNREATAVFSQSLAIPDLLESLDDENPSVVYTSLD